MLPENLIKQLKSENEFLQIQLQDLNEMIKKREDELEGLRKTALHAVELQSRLNMNLDEFYQLQDHIGNEQQRAEAAEKREISLENELLLSIDMETAFYNIRDELASKKASLTDMSYELEKMTSMYQQIADLTVKVATLESSLEIATMENGFLKEEVEACRKNETENKK